MRKDKTRRQPHKVTGTERVWWYEQPSGITVVVEPHEQTTQVFIPWRRILPAIKRAIQRVP